MAKKEIVFIVEKSSKKYKIPRHFEKEVIPYLLKNNLKNIIDFGAGKYLILTIILKKYFSNILIIETKNQIIEIEKKFSNILQKEKINIINYENFMRFNKLFDAIICSNVLHIIPFKQKRIEILKNISNKLRKNGFLYIKTSGKSIPSLSQSKNQFKFEDGYGFRFKKVGTKIYATFRTGFSLEQLLSMMPKNMKIQKKFIVNSKELSLILEKI